MPPGGGPDLRCYRVDCGKISRVLKDFRPAWTVRQGIEELYADYQRQHLEPQRPGRATLHSHRAHTANANDGAY